MGSRGPLAAADDPIAAAALPARAEVPAPPAELDEDHVAEWDEFWSSDLARVVNDVDLPVVRRLFKLRQKLDEAVAELMLLEGDDLIVHGSRGQLSRHPLVDIVAKLDGLVVRLEDKLGLSPASRARLSIELGQNKLTWKAVAARGSGGSSLPVKTRPNDGQAASAADM